MQTITVYDPRTSPEPPKTPAYRAWTGPPNPGESAVGGLAEALVAFEAELEARPVDRVIVADDSDVALAAALVATKLGVPVEVSPASAGPATASGRLLVHLAGT